jgi:hypothetical protein
MQQKKGRVFIGKGELKCAVLVPENGIVENFVTLDRGEANGANTKWGSPGRIIVV